MHGCAGWNDIDPFVVELKRRFEQGGAVKVSEVLPPTTHPHYSKILIELLRVDLELCWNNGIERNVNDYIDEFGRDIAAIRSMYGNRTSDTNDTLSINNTLQTASQLLSLVSNISTLPFVTYGDISVSGESDFYSFSNPSNHIATTTITLTSSAVSLLIPRLTEIDDSGKIIDSHASAGFDNATISITIPASSAGKHFYIEVASDQVDTFNFD